MLSNLEIIKKNSKIKLLIIMIFFVILSSILSLSFSVLIMQIIFSVLTFFFIYRKDYKTLKLYLIIFIISICFIFLVYFANEITYSSPYYMGGSDDLAFEEKGQAVLDSGIISPEKLLGNVLELYDNSPFFSIYISLIIRFGDLFDGYTTYLPRFINIYFLIWICIILEYLLKKYTSLSKNKVNISIGIFALMPNIQYINSHIFRETLNLLQILLLVYLFDKIIKKTKKAKKSILYVKILFQIILFLGLIYITYYTRRPSLAFAISLIVLIIAQKLKINKKYYIIFFIIFLILNSIFKITNLEYFIQTYTDYILSNTAKGFSRVVFQEPLLPFGIFLRILYGFISPFPNIFGLFKDSNMFLYDFVLMLRYIGVIFQIIFIPFIIKRITKIDFLSLAFMITFLVFIITTFTFRHVVFYYPFMTALAVDGYLSTAKKTRIKILKISFISSAILGLIYYFLKIL